VSEIEIKLCDRPEGRGSYRSTGPAAPWGALAPRGISAVCISAVVYFRIRRRGFIGCRLYRLLERRGPYYDFEEEDVKLRVHVDDLERLVRRMRDYPC
jgi:hypothetical protein